MNKRLKMTLIGIAALLLLIQFLPVERTNPPVTGDFDGPIEIKKIFKKSCYDCHSHENNWPWYSYVAPVSWIIAHDVNQAREEFNLSEWKSAGPRKRAHLREEIYEEVEEGEMPLPSYLLTHPGAEVSDEELKILKDWFEENKELGVDDSSDHSD